MSRSFRERAGVVLLFLAVPMLSVICQPSFGEPANVQELIKELELRRAHAVVHREIDLLDKITADESVRISPIGEQGTKAQLLTSLKSGETTYSSISVDDLTVRIYGNAALVTGRSDFQGQRSGKPFGGHCRFSRVWVKNGENWQEVLFQLTPVSDR
jgi:hypothetical protein